MDTSSISWPDIIIVAVIAISVIIGIFRGFIQEMVSLTTWVGAIILGVLFTQELVPYMTFTDVAFVKSLVSFMAIFVAVVFVGALINYFIGKVIRKTPFTIPDRILGSVFGFLRGVILVSIAVLLGGLTSVTQTDVWKESRAIQEFEKMAIWIKNRLPERFAEPFKFEDEGEEKDTGDVKPAGEVTAPDSTSSDSSKSEED